MIRIRCVGKQTAFLLPSRDISNCRTSIAIRSYSSAQAHHGCACLGQSVSSRYFRYENLMIRPPLERQIRHIVAHGSKALQCTILQRGISNSVASTKSLSDAATGIESSAHDSKFQPRERIRQIKVLSDTCNPSITCPQTCYYGQILSK